MATTTWKFERVTGTTLDFTSKVLSASIRQGREQYLDPYSGGRLQITINNTGDYTTNFSFNDIIHVSTQQGKFNHFAIEGITYDDYPGNTGLPTATLECVDSLARLGRIQVTNKSLSQNPVWQQATQFNSDLPTNYLITQALTNGNSIASAQTYSGTVLNQLNLLNATERGVIQAYATASTTTYVRCFARADIDFTVVTAVTFGRSPTTTVLAYNEFERIQNGVSFINNATIQPENLAEQTAINSTSVSAYGSTFYSSSTVDYNTTQALGNAQWIVNTFSEPSSLRFRVSLTDSTQNTTAYNNLLAGKDRLPWTLAYRLPGAVADTSLKVLLEGWQISLTPEQTRWDLYFSPLTYYQFFTLNSSTLGILNTSRLGW